MSKRFATSLEVNGHVKARFPMGSEQSGTFTATLNQVTPVDVSSAAATVNFPTTGLNPGDWVELADSQSSANTNNISAVVGLYYTTASQTVTLNTAKAHARFVYVDSTVGWVRAF